METDRSRHPSGAYPRRGTAVALISEPVIDVGHGTHIGSVDRVPKGLRSHPGWLEPMTMDEFFDTAATMPQAGA